MTATSDRRGFLRHLAGELARGAHEITPVLPALQLSTVPAATASTAPLPMTPPRTVPASPPARCASEAELVALAAEHGLEQQVDAVRRLARRSVRLTPAVAAERSRSWVGGSPTLPPQIDWPTWNGAPLPFLTQLDLRGVATDPVLPTGTLYVFYASHGCPSGLRLDHAGSVAVRHAPDAPDLGARQRRRARREARRAAGHPLELSAELTLPRAWSSAVAALELTEDEQHRWQELRRALARHQGVRLADEEPTYDELMSFHRLLGYADERNGHMPLACEAAARGIDLDEQPPYAHPLAEELQHRADRWRLLLQLTRDDDAGLSWGERRERLYVWIHEDDLRACDFSRVWAIPH